MVPSRDFTPACPCLRGDAFSFGGGFAEPTVGPHVAKTWLLALAVGCIGGDALRAYPAIEPTAQPNGHVWETCGLDTGSPSAKPNLGTSYLKLGLGQGYPRTIRHQRQCYGLPALRAEEFVEGVALRGVCMPQVTHPIGAGSPRSKPCLGGAVWSAAD